MVQSMKGKTLGLPLVALLLSCGADPLAPAPRTDLRMTAPNASLWSLSVFRPGPHAPPADGDLYQEVRMLGAATPFDTLVLEVADTLPRIVWGYRLSTRGATLCHTWQAVRPGAVVSLWCD